MEGLAGDRTVARRALAKSESDHQMRQAGYKYYLLILLMTILAFNYLDRIALEVVAQNIKSDLHLTDTELGLLSGIAFAFFYAIMGIPIARWADRGNRVAIITLTSALWSAMVVLCGRATSFLQLLLFRVGVGVGEAGCWPPANSLIPDYFTRAERPRAVAIYTLGSPLSSLIGFFAAGWLNQWFGWRIMFMLIGLPGLVLAGIVRLTIREPRLAKSGVVSTGGRLGTASRPEELEAIATPQSAGAPAAASDEPEGIREVVLTLWRIGTFRHLFVQFCVWYLFGCGLGQWTPTFFIRSFGFTSREVGIWMAVAYGVSGLIGTYVGGMLTTRYLARRERLQFMWIALVFCVVPLMWMAMFLTHNAYLSLALLSMGVLGGTTAMGPNFAAIQTLVPPRMRATAIALLFLCANLIGLGLGPLAAGAISDALRPRFGEESLRYALLTLCPGYFWAAWHVWRAANTVEGDMEAVRHLDEEGGERKDNSQSRLVNASI
jgi:MFS transporter, Spinster family, sphingosine-1-phosphate transporter